MHTIIMTGVLYLNLACRLCYVVEVITYTIIPRSWTGYRHEHQESIMIGVDAELHVVLGWECQEVKGQ